MFRKMKWFIAMLLVFGVCTEAIQAELIGYWPFEEGQGTETADITGNGNDGTINGDVEWVDGYMGDGVRFDTAGERIVIGPLAPSAETNAMTLAAWINWEGQDHTIAHQGIIGKRLGWTTDGATTKWFWETTPAGDLVFRADYDGGGTGLWWGNGILTPYANEWTHVAVTWDNGAAVEYINAEEVETGNITFRDSANDTPVTIGCVDSTNNETFVGTIDEARIYNHALTPAEIETIMLGIFPTAFSPSPADGAIHEDTWVTLSWMPGTSAVSHDVYLGEAFDDVNDATHDSDVFRGNQGSTFYVAGFPGFAYPEGLVPGTMYYWRIDEVEADGITKHKGDVWSFTIPSKTAFNPVPADGAKFIETDNPTLSWMAGFRSKLHTVYFGNDFDTVANAVGGMPQAALTYNPGPLEPDTTYYWRVDEFDGAGTNTGEVWSFTTARIGGGVKGQYFKGMNFETFVLTRTDPQIDFDWGDPGGPDPAVGDDQFSIRWNGEVEAAFTETYTFYTRSDDGVRLWIDGELIIENWTNHAATEDKAEFDLVAGNTHSLQMEYYEDGSGAVAQLSWSSPRTPKQIIPQAALSLPLKASIVSPSNGATDTSLTQILTWNTGDLATSHDVYFGTDADAVANATKASLEFKATKAIDDTSYDPGKLAWHTTYYWRVDEISDTHPDSPWIGSVWSFTTADYLLVEDFESYTDDDVAGLAIWQHWIDGFGVADNGSQVGYLLPPYAEQTIVNRGRQSMPLLYNNIGGIANSEAVLTLSAARDWTEEGVGELSLWFHGLPGSVGSFVEGPAGTYTMTGSGTDIWDMADEFHFAYKMLNGAGSITARVESVQNTNGWAKACVMIRETLDPGSKHAIACITPSNGVASQGRTIADTASFGDNQTGITAPHWIKLERDVAGNFTVTHSANGTTWGPVAGATPHNISMASNVYIGLALTSHDAALTCEGVFSNVTTTGNVSGQWTNQDIGITSNSAEPLYVAASNASGAPAVVANSDPAAALIDVWTEWRIPLQAFADQGINLGNVDKIAIGLGSKSRMTAPGGSGTMYIDDIRLYRSEP
ncbi:PA14 domain-containing protein [Planctomycetota bacterium]